MTLDFLRKQYRDEILRIAAAHGARNVRVFGSVVRNEARPDSDVDFLVDVEAGRSLLDVAGLWIDLETVLGRKIDVVLDGGISPYLQDRIQAEAQAL